MNDQLKHDTAVAAARAAVEALPECLLLDERDKALTGFTRVVHAALDAYDHFRAQETDPKSHAECACRETDRFEPEAL